MNANIQFFSNPQFGNIRTLELNNKMWFGATDVATSLGYSNPRDAVVRHCKPKGVVIHDVGVQTGIKSDGTPAIQNVQMKFINEGNLYRLVASSQLPKADEFESWIFDEVIPSVIRTGGYIATNEGDTADEIMARALVVAKDTLARREERIKSLQEESSQQIETIHLLTNEVKQSAPIIKCYKEYISSDGTFTTTQIAKEYGWGAETLNKKLSEMGIQYKQNGQWILYAKYDGKGYTVSKPVTFPKNDGTTGTQMQTRWTSKGREFIHSLFAN